MSPGRILNLISLLWKISKCPPGESPTPFGHLGKSPSINLQPHLTALGNPQLSSWRISSPIGPPWGISKCSPRESTGGHMGILQGAVGDSSGGSSGIGDSPGSHMEIPQWGQIGLENLHRCSWRLPRVVKWGWRFSRRAVGDSPGWSDSTGDSPWGHLEIPQVGQMGLEIPQVGQMGLEIPQVGQMGLEIPQVGQMGLEIPQVGQMGLEIPQVGQMGLEIPQVGQMGLEIPQVGQMGLEIPQDGQTALEILQGDIWRFP
ncbi:hypothetical protein EV401DRAFT_2073244 [Pisolithus croceorrhizus]|nr:hypothetical protein EV401DRAFT_2073244 [Pisolithus croceorrhizus]